MTRKKTCTIDGRVVHACSPLFEVTDCHPFSNGKGVCEWDGTDTETGKLIRRMYGVKGGEHRKQGLAFNFCPFCGVDLSASLS